MNYYEQMVFNVTGLTDIREINELLNVIQQYEELSGINESKLKQYIANERV